MSEPPAPASGETVTLPITEEQVRVERVQTVSDHVRVSTGVESREVLAEALLERGVLSVERHAVERAVDAAPPVREEGDTVIVSVVEERLVTTRQLFVVEEVRIRRSAVHERVAVPVTLRRTRVSVEREGRPEPSPAAPARTESIPKRES